MSNFTINEYQEFIDELQSLRHAIGSLVSELVKYREDYTARAAIVQEGAQQAHEKTTEVFCSQCEQEGIGVRIMKKVGARSVCAMHL